MMMLFYTIWIKRSFSTIKFHNEASEVISQVIRPGQTLLIGGFGLCGIPEHSIDAICNAPNRLNRLTVIGDGVGTSDFGTGRLIAKGLVDKVVCSFIGSNRAFEKLYLENKILTELVPQGTLIERLRAAGAGIPAFYTSTGLDSSAVSVGKERATFNGRAYLLETALKGDVALVKAWRADPYGNIIFRKSSMNFNPMCAKAARVTIVEVEEILPQPLDPDQIHLPNIYVDHVIYSDKFEKRIEHPTLREKFEIQESDTMEKERHRIAKRIAKELEPGAYVNLGIGIPMIVSEYIQLSPSKSQAAPVIVHSENGILGMGRYPLGKEQQDADLINAGKETVTLVPGGSFFGSDESFAMIRGGHLNYTILGGIEVSQYGDLANWTIPGKRATGMGGAMDLSASSHSGTKIIVGMTHLSKNGESKIKPDCSFPLTGKRCVSKIVTELAVFSVLPNDSGLLLTDIYSGTTVEAVLSNTPSCRIQVSDDLKHFE
jgi:3-oxoacid CoA-transferase